jgi:polar amino acid transport system substrate-binding protein
MARLKLTGFVLPLLACFLAPLANADVLDDILDRGTIRVGVSEFVPWTLKSKAGELIGFEIEISKKIADDMGVTAEFKVYKWEQIIPALQNGEIDIIAGGMAITPARALLVNFSQPLATSGTSLATNSKLTENVASLQDLNGEAAVITVVADTFAQSVAEIFFDQANIKTYPSVELAQKEVLEARAHAYVGSDAAVKFFAMTNRKTVDTPIKKPFMASKEGLAVKKGEQQLLNFLNAWIVARDADNWLGASHAYWFDTIEWMADAK